MMCFFGHFGPNLHQHISPIIMAMFGTDDARDITPNRFYLDERWWQECVVIGGYPMKVQVAFQAEQTRETMF